MSKKKPAALRVLKDYYSNWEKPRDPTALLADLEKESDRAAVIIFASILEDVLTLALAGKMRKFEDKAAFDRIFDFNGPLGTFSAKILMAHRLSVIESDTYRQLEIIREMRNACAHSQYAISFKTPELASACMLLFEGIDDPFVAYDGTPQEQMKEAFLSECMWLSMAINIGSRDGARDDFEKEQAK
jgi:hypothetical protein